MLPLIGWVLEWFVSCRELPLSALHEQRCREWGLPEASGRPPITRQRFDTWPCGRTRTTLELLENLDDDFGMSNIVPSGWLPARKARLTTLIVAPIDDASPESRYLDFEGQ